MKIFRKEQTKIWHNHPLAERWDTVLSTTALSLEKSWKKAELITIYNPTQLESEFIVWKMKREENFLFSRVVLA